MQANNNISCWSQGRKRVTRHKKETSQKPREKQAKRKNACKKTKASSKLNARKQGNEKTKRKSNIFQPCFERTYSSNALN